MSPRTNPHPSPLPLRKGGVENLAEVAIKPHNSVCLSRREAPVRTESLEHSNPSFTQEAGPQLSLSLRERVGVRGNARCLIPLIVYFLTALILRAQTLDVYWIDSEGGGSTLIKTPA